MKTTWNRMTVVFLAGIVLACTGSCDSGGGSGGAPPPPGGTVTAVVSANPVGVGKEFEVSVEVSNSSDIFSAAFDVAYDPDIIEYMSTTEGTMLSEESSVTTSMLVSLENDTEGRLVAGVTRLGQVGSVMGSGTVITFSFRGVSAGTSEISFGSPRGLLNETGSEVEIGEWKDTSITIQ